MYAIASLLDTTGEQVVLDLWKQFSLRCLLPDGATSLLPHFTWVSAESYPLEPVERILEEIAGDSVLFRARSAGLGVFTGAAPVVYVPLVKDKKLLDLHQEVWERLLPYAESPNIYYDPDRWMPHITLALHDVESDRLGCAVAETAMQPIDFEIVVDHFAVLYQADMQSGIQARVGFANSNQNNGG